MEDLRDELPRPEHHHQLYRLTALQIGDLQSYVSRLYLFLACKKSKLVLLVDNGPWTAEEGRSRPAELWQLMVTKSRVSPFANQRHRRRSVTCTKTSFLQCSCCSDERMTEALQLHRSHSYKWLLNRLQNQCKHTRTLCPDFYGCVAFEVAWTEVRGMNYLNELQTDTCLSLEVKNMRKREFDSLEQALTYYGSQCELDSEEEDETMAEIRQEIPSTPEWTAEISSDLNFSPKFCSQRNLETAFTGSGITGLRLDIATLVTGTNTGHVPESDSPCITDRVLPRTGIASVTRMTGVTGNRAWKLPEADATSTTGLQQVRTGRTVSLPETDTTSTSTTGCRGKRDSNYSEDTGSGRCITGSGTGISGRDKGRGLTEVGVSETYRDTLVLFKFCDPFLPFELNEIITGDQRLLKMLESGLPSWVIFLQSYPILCYIYRPWIRPLARTVHLMVNITSVIIGFYDLYKNVPLLKTTAALMLGPLYDWIGSWEMVSRLKYLGTMLVLNNYESILLTIRTARQLISVLMRPVVEPLILLWTFLLPFFISFFNLLISFFSPFGVFISALWNLGYVILSPLFSGIRMVLLLPVYSVQYVYDLVGMCIYDIANAVMAMWSPLVSSVQSAPPPSVWRTLWNDLFSKVFRAVRYIVNGFVAFFTVLNRHRLSIYNNLVAVVMRMVNAMRYVQCFICEIWSRIPTYRHSSAVDKMEKDD